MLPSRGLLAALGFSAAVAARAPAMAALPQGALPAAARAALVQDWHRLQALYPGMGGRTFVVVDISRQQLYLFRNGALADTWPVSTGRGGTGERENSFRTPLGAFRIAGKIGAGLPAFAALDRNGPSGGQATPVFAPDDPGASGTIISRILALEGLEPGWNEGGDVDTYRRHIYIHGTANLGALGEPASAGCVQMAPGAVIRLFRSVSPGTLVLITPGTGNLEDIPGEAPPPIADDDAG